METSRCCVAWSDLGIGHDSLVWTPGQNRPESTRVTSPSEHDHDGIWIRGSASSRIVGFVSVFLILSRCYYYSTLLHPPVSTLPPFVASHFFSPRRSDFFLPFSNCPSHHYVSHRDLNDVAANGRFPTAMPLTRVVEAPTTCSVLGTVAGWRKKIRFAMAVRDPDIVS